MAGNNGQQLLLKDTGEEKNLGMWISILLKPANHQVANLVG